MIPVQNVRNLMLRGDVVEAVAAGQFRIYPVATIDEGIEILTGVAAGTKENGSYPEGTINYLVEQRLREFAEKMKEFGKGDESAKT